MFRQFTLLIGFVVLMMGCQSSGSYQLQVEAGPHSRLPAAISFELPAELLEKQLQLVSPEGTVFPVQSDQEGTGWFVTPSLSAGQNISLALQIADQQNSGMTINQAEGKLYIRQNQQPVLTYNFEEVPPPTPDIPQKYQRGGYIHPVITPSGTVITDDYPSNHVHHHGIWGAWTKTIFQDRTPDFWNMGDSSGTVNPVRLLDTWQGPVSAGFSAQHVYVDLSGPSAIEALKEIWQVKVYNLSNQDKDYFMFDQTVIQECSTDDTLFLPEYRYGGVGFRGLAQWNGEGNTTFLTSEGKDRSTGHATRANWCYVGGKVDGNSAGIAIMCHPDNFEAPQPMRIHPHEPFFNYAPSQAGDWYIAPSKPYIARYRYIVYDGEPDPDWLDQLWQNYADPPKVHLVKN
ncbi:MAG: PmoA family protein [Candidatus Cyclobacteriaceae bacterium M3_2C_046]